MTTEDNKAVVRRYFEEYHTGRSNEILEEILTAELLAPTRGVTDRVATAFPDYRITVNAQVAEGDLVATVWTGEGTHEGEWASPIGNVAATGRRVRWTATTTLRISNGKISEVVGSNWGHLGILQQAGAVASQEPRPGA